MGVVRRAGSREQALALVDIFYPPEKRPGLPIGEAWDAYTRIAKATGRLAIEERTLSRRRNVFDRFCEWLADNCPAVETAEEVTGPIAGRYAEHIAKTKTRGNKLPSAKTRQNILGELGTVWRTLEKVSAGIHNPFAGLAPVDVDGNRGEAFTPEQERAILKAAKAIGKGWYLACLIARHTGLRYGDVATLRWEYIDLKAGKMSVTPRKTARHRIRVTLPIESRTLAPALSEARKSASGEGWVFPLHAQLYGNRSESAYKALNFKEVLDAAGVTGDGYTFHSWRHTMRSRLAEAGADMETAKRLLGHTSDAMSEHYDHADHMEELTAAIEAAAKK
jgi:site-specific recombinase XerD